MKFLSIPMDARAAAEALLEKRGAGRYSLGVLCLCGFGWMSDGAENVVLSYMLPTLEDLWSLSPGQLGAMSTAIYFGQAAGATFWGALADAGGRRLDTARIYAGGDTEPMVAAAIKGCPGAWRLGTKAAPSVAGGLSADGFRAQFDASRAALKTSAPLSERSPARKPCPRRASRGGRTRTHFLDARRAKTAQ